MPMRIGLGWAITDGDSKAIAAQAVATRKLLRVSKTGVRAMRVSCRWCCAAQ
jgi:hypothetical protein